MKQPNIVLTGCAGTGKSTLARYLADEYNYTELSFAAPLKRVVQQIYKFSNEQLYGPSSMRDAPDLRYPRADGTHLTPREALQRIGTDACRSCYEDTWLDLAMEDAFRTNQLGPSWVFDDCRFANELDECVAGGALAVRLTRAGCVASAHPSEAGMASLPDDEFDLVLSTDGTKAETQAAFDAFMRGIGVER